MRSHTYSVFWSSPFLCRAVPAEAPNTQRVTGQVSEVGNSGIVVRQSVICNPTPFCFAPFCYVICLSERSQSTPQITGSFNTLKFTKVSCTGLYGQNLGDEAQERGVGAGEWKKYWGARGM
jgi:hypothetical protein